MALRKSLQQTANDWADGLEDRNARGLHGFFVASPDYVNPYRNPMYLLLEDWQLDLVIFQGWAFQPLDVQLTALAMAVAVLGSE